MLFLDIPESEVRSLYIKCETFVNNLQLGEDDEMMSVLNESKDGNHIAEDSSDKRKRKKRKFKDTGSS